MVNNEIKIDKVNNYQYKKTIIEKLPNGFKSDADIEIFFNSKYMDALLESERVSIDSYSVDTTVSYYKTKNGIMFREIYDGAPLFFYSPSPEGSIKGLILNFLSENTEQEISSEKIKELDNAISEIKSNLPDMFFEYVKSEKTLEADERVLSQFIENNISLNVRLEAMDTELLIMCKGIIESDYVYGHILKEYKVSDYSSNWTKREKAIGAVRGWIEAYKIRLEKATLATSRLSTSLQKLEKSQFVKDHFHINERVTSDLFYDSIDSVLKRPGRFEFEYNGKKINVKDLDYLW